MGREDLITPRNMGVEFSIVVTTTTGLPLEEEGITHLPSVVELIVAHKVEVIALERVEDERLVRLGDRIFRESPLVLKSISVGSARVVQTGTLVFSFRYTAFGGLNAEDELVAADIF